MIDLKYRKGTKDDVPQLMELRLAAFSQFAEVFTPENWAKMHASLIDEQKLLAMMEVATIFTCRHNARIVGVAYLVPQGNPTAICPAEWANLRMVGVLPAYRGHGIAKKLTQQCIAHAKDTGEKTIGLHTSEVMNAARHIYESLGFTVVKEIEPLFGVKYWLYKLDL